jgi:hypothetical protein
MDSCREQTLRELIDNTARALEAGDSEAQVPLLRAWVGKAQGWYDKPYDFLHEHPRVVTADPLTVHDIRDRMSQHPRRRGEWVDPGVDEMFPEELAEDDDFVAFVITRVLQRVQAIPEIEIRDAARKTPLLRTDLGLEGQADVMDDFIRDLIDEVAGDDSFVIETVALWKVHDHG